jgi:seryl-tRNA synthetase
MGKNGAKSQDEFIELCGWEIKRVKEGLDETQVTSLITELISQREQLTQRTEHLSSLTNLAERTVTEADKLAEEMKVQAVEQAKNETASLIAEAEAKAQEIENEIKKIQLEMRSSVQEIVSKLISGLDSIKQQAEALQAESEQKLSQTSETDKPVTEPVDETPVDTQQSTRHRLIPRNQPRW